MAFLSRSVCALTFFCSVIVAFFCISPLANSISTTVDPFALASGIAGLASLAIEVTRITKEYVQDARNCSKEFAELDEALVALARVLKQLERLLKLESAGKLAFEKTSGLFATYDACKTKMDDVHARLQKRLQDRRARQVLKA